MKRGDFLFVADWCFMMLRPRHHYLTIPCLGDLKPLAQLRSSLSPWRPASRSLWPASFPVARGNPMSRSALDPRPASWAGTLPPSWEWCLCCLMWRCWAAGWALLPSDSSGCSSGSGGVGGLALWVGHGRRHLRYVEDEQMRLHIWLVSCVKNALGANKYICVCSTLVSCSMKSDLVSNNPPRTTAGKSLSALP